MKYHFSHCRYDEKLRYEVQGTQMNSFRVSIDGIALTPDRSTVFYNALLGEHLYSVSAAELRQGVVEAAVDHGVKPASDGLAFADNGKLYFGSLRDSRRGPTTACI
jgi:hypothetical protein